jgi:hypothetical protein
MDYYLSSWYYHPIASAPNALQNKRIFAKDHV